MPVTSGRQEYAELEAQWSPKGFDPAPKTVAVDYYPVSYKSDFSALYLQSL